MSSSQTVTPELKRWIVEQARAGHSPETVLASMRSSGWDEDIAVQALEDTLSTFLAEQAESAMVPSPVPDIDMQASGSVVDVGDREVRVLMHLKHPRIIVFGGLLSDDECDELIELARPRLSRSETVDTATGGNEVNAARTSQGMFFERGEHPVCQRLEQRLGRLLRWPVENGEGLQILRYGPGAEYRPHHDYFDPAQAGTPSILRRGGQRVATIVTYLNTPRRGGATTFPDIALDVAALKGHAVFFNYDRPHPATRTLHGGAPVLEGEKWVATKWLRAGRFD